MYCTASYSVRELASCIFSLLTFLGDLKVRRREGRDNRVIKEHMHIRFSFVRHLRKFKIHAANKRREMAIKSNKKTSSDADNVEKNSIKQPKSYNIKIKIEMAGVCEAMEITMYEQLQ